MLRTVAILALLSPGPSRIWMRSHSIEWWTNIADDIAVVDVAGLDPLEALNEVWDSRKVRWKQAEVLRGRAEAEGSLRHDFRRGGEPDVKAGQRLLLFQVRKPRRIDENPVFWVNLSAPDPPRGSRAAYDNRAWRLETEKDILDLVRSRLVGEAAKAAPRKRGVIVPFPGVDDMYWDFVRTADEDLKPKLMERLGDGGFWGRCAAIHNLVSYPGPDTVQALKACLKDEATQEIQLYGEKRETIRYYPVRQAAYLALGLLGEKVERPEPFYEEARDFLFDTGMDVRVYFPYGDWKRLKD